METSSSLRQNWGRYSSDFEDLNNSKWLIKASAEGLNMHLFKRENKSHQTLLFELHIQFSNKLDQHVNNLDQTREVNEMLIGSVWEKHNEYNHQEQHPLVDASGCGGFSLKMFFFTPAEPSAKRLGVSKICRSTWYHHIINTSHGLFVKFKKILT